MDITTAQPTVLVPLRSPGAGKSRLSGALSVEERAGLAGAMLADVAAALRDAGLASITVAAGGEAASAAASALGLDVIRDGHEVHGLNAAISHALRIIGLHRTVLVVAADLPDLRAEDVHAVLAPDSDVVIAPTEDGGTGALLRRPAGAMGHDYGPGSGARHVDLARAQGLSCSVVTTPGFAADVDTPVDLRAVLGPGRGAATSAFLASSGIAERLQRNAG